MTFFTEKVSRKRNRNKGHKGIGSSGISIRPSLLGWRLLVLELPTDPKESLSDESHGFSKWTPPVGGTTVPKAALHTKG